MCLLFNDTATPEIYTYCHTLSLHDSLPIWCLCPGAAQSVFAGMLGRRNLRRLDALPDRRPVGAAGAGAGSCAEPARSEEHTSELQSLLRISYAVFCLKKKIRHNKKAYQCHTKNS